MERICQYPDCKNIGRWSKKIKGILYRGKYCDKHHWQIYDITRKRTRNKPSYKDRLRRKIGLKPCSVCGWNKDNCDVHRIINGKDGGKYNKTNVIALCPNCHRLVHSGILVF